MPREARYPRSGVMGALVEMRRSSPVEMHRRVLAQDSAYHQCHLCIVMMVGPPPSAPQWDG